MQGVLLQFLFRLTLATAIASAALPLRLADGGSCRVGLWFLAAVNATAAVLVYRDPAAVEYGGLVLALALATTAVCFAGSIFWQRGQADTARLTTGAAGLLALLNVIVAARWGQATTTLGLCLGIVDLASSGLLLGVTMAASLLSFWHLNTPKMQAVPLRALTQVMGGAVVVRTLLCLIALGVAMTAEEPPMPLFGAFLTLRWLMAVLGVVMLAWLAKESRAGPTLQGAAGLLFLGIVAAMVGELGSQWLPVNSLYRV